MQLWVDVMDDGQTRQSRQGCRISDNELVE